jgi:hypothetical protein
MRNPTTGVDSCRGWLCSQSYVLGVPKGFTDRLPHDSVVHAVAVIATILRRRGERSVQLPANGDEPSLNNLQEARMAEDHRGSKSSAATVAARFSVRFLTYKVFLTEPFCAAQLWGTVRNYFCSVYFCN